MRAALLLCLACAATTAAQDFVGSGFLESSRGQEDRRHVSTTGLFALPADVINHDSESVAYWRMRADASFDVYKTRRWGLTGSAKLSYLGISDSGDAMPPRLIRVGTGLGGYFITAQKLPAFLAFFSNLEMRSDFDSPHLRDLKFSQGVMASFVINTKWTFTAGLFYTTEFFQTRAYALRYFPLPLVMMTYKHSDELSVSMGMLNVTVRYKPVKYLDLRASYNVPLALQLSLSHEILDWFTIREFFGHHEETYNLTGERWPEYTKVEQGGWGTGAIFEFTPFDGWFKPLENSAIRLTYQFGFLQRWRIFTYDDDDTRTLYELAPTHNFALTISIAL